MQRFKCCRYLKANIALVQGSILSNFAFAKGIWQQDFLQVLRISMFFVFDNSSPRSGARFCVAVLGVGGGETSILWNYIALYRLSAESSLVSKLSNYRNFDNTRTEFLPLLEFKYLRKFETNFEKKFKCFE